MKFTSMLLRRYSLFILLCCYALFTQQLAGGQLLKHLAAHQSLSPNLTTGDLPVYPSETEKSSHSCSICLALSTLLLPSFASQLNFAHSLLAYQLLIVNAVMPSGIAALKAYDSQAPPSLLHF